MIKKYLLNALIALLTIVSTSAVNASETAWFETDGGNVRILTEPFLPGANSVRGMIDIDLQPGWKTYWRDPGSGGIPPAIQINDVDLEMSTEIAFPVPKWIVSKYGSYAGYDKPVQIPFTLKTAEPLVERDINTRIFIGICKDICIPAFSDFEISLTEASGSSKAGIMVAAAFEALPQEPKLIDVSVSATPMSNQKLRVEIDGEAGDFALFVSGRNGEQFVKPELMSRETGKIIYHVEPLDPFEDGQNVDIILTGHSSEASFETSVPIVFKEP